MSSTLEARFRVKTYVSLISKQEINGLLEKGKREMEAAEKESTNTPVPLSIRPSRCTTYWRYFFENLPSEYGYLGYYTFTRIGFSSNYRFAFVEIHGRGCDSSLNGAFELIRTKKGWIVNRAGVGFMQA